MLKTFQEFTANGRPQGGTIPEDLRDFVENVSAKDRPALALFRKTRIATTYVEWLQDVLPSRTHNAWLEGADATDPALVTPTRSSTVAQNFAGWGKVSDVQRAVEHKGFADAFLYQEKKVIDAVLNDIEHALHRGSAASGNTSATRQFAGLLNITGGFLSDQSGQTCTEDKFSDMLQLFLDGNTEIRPTTCFVNSYLKRTISQYTTKVTRNIDAAARAQTLVIDSYSSDFGDVRIFYARDQLQGTTKAGVGNSLVLLDPSFFEIGWLQPLMSEVLARSGLATQFQISAMCTLIYRTEKALGGGRNLCPYIV
jgi:hypothetical protein